MFTKKDLRNGDVCVLNNGIASIYVDLLGGVFVRTTGYNVSCNWTENLTNVVNRFVDDDAFDIVKIYRPKESYQCCFYDSLYTDGDLVFDRERDCKPILDKDEREYLSAVIKPFRDKVDYIVKVNGKPIPVSYLRIVLKNSDAITFPNLTNDTMYKGMELNKQYTLSDLGL